MTGYHTPSVLEHRPLFYWELEQAFLDSLAIDTVIPVSIMAFSTGWISQAYSEAKISAY